MAFGRRNKVSHDTTNTTRSKNVGAGKILTLLSALLIPIWLLAFGAWCVQLVGLALIQHQQTGGGHFLQFDWFVTAITFTALILVPFHLIARRSSPGIVAFLAVVTVLEILRTNVWNNARLVRGDVLGLDVATRATQIDSVINPGLNADTKRVLTLFSGYLITSAFNLLLILGLGNLPASSAQDARQVEHGVRNAADQHKHDNYNGTSTMNQPGVHNNGVAHNGGLHNGNTTNGAPHPRHVDEFPHNGQTGANIV